jgi:hypothetical protein
MSSIASRSHRRMSVATWSLRERPVCRRLPASPTSAVRRFSMLRCTSSSASFHSKAPDSISSTPPSPDAQDAPPPGLPMTEVCQVGVVLRALLGVQGVVALGAAFDAAGPAQWLNRFLLACAVSVPALLAWLLVACSLRLRLAAWPPLKVRAALLGLGALCAWTPWWLVQELERWLDSGPRRAGCAGWRWRSPARWRPGRCWSG